MVNVMYIYLASWRELDFSPDGYFASYTIVNVHGGYLFGNTVTVETTARALIFL